MKVLVVGGAGYIGSHCVRQLLAAGHEPVVLDNLIYGHRAAVGSGIPFHEATIADATTVDRIFTIEKPDAVMHFAAYAYVGESVSNPLKYYQNNVAATLTLLEVMLRHGVKKFVFSSTCATYGVPEKMPITEAEPQSPINPYGQTKLDVEKILKALALANALSFAALRYFNAAGASEDAAIGEDHDPETHLIPLAIWAAMGISEQLRIFGNDYPTPDGTCLRDYVHVDDLSRAHIAALRLLQPSGAQHFFNLGTGQPTSVLEVVKAVEKASGLEVPIRFAPRRAGDPPALYADAAKANRELRWNPKYQTIDPIVETAWRWHKARPNGYPDLGEDRHASAARRKGGWI